MQVHLVAAVGEPTEFSSPWLSKGAEPKQKKTLKDCSDYDITRIVMNVADDSYPGLVLGAGGKSVVDEDYGGSDDDW